MSANSGGQVAVFIESGSRRVFASALDWPGWARSGKSEQLALAALADYLRRYEAIVALAGLPGPGDAQLVVTERHPGVAKGADFGALGEIATSERAPLTPQAGTRLAVLLEAAWAAFDWGAEQAPPRLRKGPRGGGRDTEQIVQHVLGAEAMYSRKMGLARDKAAEVGHDPATLLRRRVTTALRAPAELPAGPNQWPPRYAARRMAWHVLDHLWEIEDKSDPA